MAKKRREEAIDDGLLCSMGVEPVAAHAPEVFGTLLKSEVDRWRKVIRESRITVQ